MDSNRHCNLVHHYLQLGIALCSLFIGSAAYAGGIFVPDLGTVSLGRGGAFVARSDDLTAIYYNPAGLSKREGVNVLIGGSLVNSNVDFTRWGSGRTDIDYVIANDELTLEDPALDYSDPENPVPFRTVSQETPVNISAVSVVCSWGNAFGVNGLAMAIGLLAPSGAGAPKFPADGPQRYSLIEMSSMVIYPSFAISYAFNRYFQIGGVFLSGMAFVEKKFASRLSPAFGDIDHNEDAGGDAKILLTANDYFMPSGIFGVLSNPLDWLELGVSVRLPVYMEAEGKVDFTAPKLDLSNAKLVKDDAVISQHFPWVVSAGVRYIHRRFDIEVDFVFEDWSTYEYMEAKFDASIDLEGDGTQIREMPDSKIPKNWRDTYSVRLGSDIEVWPENLTVRLGGYYQSSAYPENNNTMSVDFPFAEQLGAGLGLTWHAFGLIDVSASYLHVFQADIAVTEGILQQSGQPLEMPDGELLATGNVINNGLYEVSLNIFSLSLEGHF